MYNVEEELEEKKALKKIIFFDPFPYVFFTTIGTEITSR